MFADVRLNCRNDWSASYKCRTNIVWVDGREREVKVNQLSRHSIRPLYVRVKLAGQMYTKWSPLSTASSPARAMFSSRHSSAMTSENGARTLVPSVESYHQWKDNTIFIETNGLQEDINSLLFFSSNETRKWEHMLHTVVAMKGSFIDIYLLIVCSLRFHIYFFHSNDYSRAESSYYSSRGGFLSRCEITLSADCLSSARTQLSFSRVTFVSLSCQFSSDGKTAREWGRERDPYICFIYLSQSPMTLVLSSHLSLLLSVHVIRHRAHACTLSLSHTLRHTLTRKVSNAISRSRVHVEGQYIHFFWHASWWIYHQHSSYIYSREKYTRAVWRKVNMLPQFTWQSISLSLWFQYFSLNPSCLTFFPLPLRVSSLSLSCLFYRSLSLSPCATRIDPLSHPFSVRVAWMQNDIEDTVLYITIDRNVLE